MEKVDLRRSSGKAICVGTILAVSGASLITLFKGPLLLNHISSSNSFEKQEEDDHHHHILLSHHSSWVLGGFLFLMASLLSANWHIVQVRIKNVHGFETVKATIKHGLKYLGVFYSGFKHEQNGLLLLF